MEGTLFPDLPAAAPDPNGIIRAASLSDCGQYRWTLMRKWRAGPHVCFIGLNPSTADATKDDPTVRRWIHFANAWGYGGFVAVNLYPFRSPNPAACKRWSDWLNNGPDYYARDRMFENEDVVAREAKRAALVVACWGAGTWDEMWTSEIVSRITAGDEPWPDIHCFGRTGSGDPIHPMARGRNRVLDDQQPVLWREGES